MEGKWMYNCTGGDIWTGEEYSTKEEAIKAGNEETRSYCFEVGKIEKVNLACVDVDCLLEGVFNSVFDEVGEIAEDYLEDVTTEHKLKLEKSLNEVFLKWVEENGYKPSFFKIANVETIFAK